MKFLTLLLFLIISLTAKAQSPWYYGSGAAVNLENAIQYKNTVRSITGPLDPSAVAVSAPAGSLYQSTNGNIYIKQDAGSSTNWSVVFNFSSTIPFANLSSPPASLEVWVDKNRVDTYTEDGTYLRPYKSLDNMYAAINDATTSKKYIAHIVPGEYIESNTLELEAFIELVADDNEAVTIERTNGTDIPIDCTSSNKRIAIRNISFPNGLTVDKTGTTTQGCIILITNTDIYGSFTFNGIGGGSDFVTFRDSRIFSNVTINAVSSSVFASILYGTNTFGTVGGTNADIYGSMAFADIQNSYLWDIAFDVETGMDGYYQIARSTVGNTVDADALGTGTMTIVPDSVSFPTSSASYTPSGSVTLSLATRAHVLGYSPLTPANWGTVPNDVSEALDYLAGVGFVVGPASSTDKAIARFDLTTGKLIQNSVVTISDLGAMSGITQLNVDNLSLDGNTISSTDVNGSILLDPNGTGSVNLPDLTASTPLKLDASKNIVSSDIDLTTDVTGILPIANGGTNSSTALSGSSIMISNGTSIVQGDAGTTTTVLHGNASGAPTYGAVSLTADVSGILPLANGGTNKNMTAVNGGVVWTDADSMEVIAAGTSGQVLQSNGAAAPTWVTLPSGETVSSQTASFTAAFNTIYLTTNAINVQLPAPVANGKITIKKTDSSVVVILRAASETIDGSAGSYTMAGDKDSIVLVTDGANWFIISGV